MSDYLEEANPSENPRMIGCGISSIVTVGTNPNDGRKYAVKQFYTDCLDKASFIREIEFLVALNHPCILRILGFSFPSRPTTARIRTEYAENGSLASVLKRARDGSKLNFWNPTGRGLIIFGIVLGMRFVHSCGILHRDLKPSNILINDLGHALIGDFGVSAFDWDDGTMTAETGTVNYAAPEQFREEEPTNKIDVFAFGLIAYEIFVGIAVFPHSMYPGPIMKRILAGDLPRIPDECGQFMQELIARCWSMDPESRPCFADIAVELQSNDFANFPGADPRVIREYVTGILAWEARYLLAKQKAQTS
jgi:serine/threonine protein kinase